MMWGGCNFVHNTIPTPKVIVSFVNFFTLNMYDAILNLLMHYLKIVFQVSCIVMHLSITSVQCKFFENGDLIFSII